MTKNSVVPTVCVSSWILLDCTLRWDWTLGFMSESGVVHLGSFAPPLTKLSLSLGRKSLLFLLLDSLLLVRVRLVCAKI
jgi:hypothetical protein